MNRRMCCGRSSWGRRSTLLPSGQPCRSLNEFDFEYVKRVFYTSMQAARAGQENKQRLEPFTDVLSLQEGSSAERAAWLQAGMQLLAQGKVAVLLLAGGQGTRLGSSLPKGCYDIGLPSHKSLFQLQAERLLRLQQLVAEQQLQQPQQPRQDQQAAGRPVAPRSIPWLIMTSPFTHQDTLKHFEEHAFFGLQPCQVSFFQQGSLPCLTKQGTVIMASTSQLAKAPDGNGGVFRALKTSGLLDRLQAEGVECLDCYCVDNALARLGDPLFLGYCHSKAAQVGARVVAKASADEKVGVFASREGALSVVEYSEMEPGQAHATNPDTGALLYKWSNICMHYFSVEWLQQLQEHLAKGTAYHVAHKVIPSIDGPVQGIKLEMFIFDPFPTAHTVALVEVSRQEQFAPVKNAPGSATDSPDTARAAVLAQGAAWVEAAGGVLAARQGVAGVEVSPLVSYAGEGLAGLVAGRCIVGSWDDVLQGKLKGP
ncbi:nucleotide-diphospho-sugar transferase [Haematococcus lacustris]